MVTQSDWSLIELIHQHNENRTYHSREYVGALYFILGLGILQISLLCGAVQAYVFPLRRFYRLHINFMNTKINYAIHTVFVTALMFIVIAGAGASGYIVMNCLIGLWLLILTIILVVRRVRANNKSSSAPSPHHPGGERRVSHDVSGSFSPNERRLSAMSPNERRASGVQVSASFDLGGMDSQSFDNLSLDSHENPAATSTALKHRMKRLQKLQGEWTVCPVPMAPGQMAHLISLIFGCVIVCVVFIGVFFAWKVDDYLVVSPSGGVEVEVQPSLNGKSLQLLYAFPTIATKFSMQLYVKLFTKECGVMYTKTLSDDSAKKSKIYDGWISPYGINMSQFIPSDYRQYSTVDDWFTRAIDLSLRPQPDSVTAIVSPADCRMQVYDQATDMLFYLKGYHLSISSLLSNFEIDGYPRYFDNAAVVIARLAPQDYHRFHSPVSGKILAVRRVSGTYWSVSADAARSGNQAFLNERVIVIIDAGPRLGFVAYVGIGATCVGSVRFDVANVTVGAEVVRGEPLGSMHFGGSTVLVLFSKGRIIFDQIMLQRSRFGVETRVLANAQIGASR